MSIYETGKDRKKDTQTDREICRIYFCRNFIWVPAHGIGRNRGAGLHPRILESLLDFATANSMQDIGRKLLQAVGFASPDDVSIQAAIEANDAFIAQLEQIRDRAQQLTLTHSG
jgi:hypothetical protein